MLELPLSEYADGFRRKLEPVVIIEECRYQVRLLPEVVVLTDGGRPLTIGEIAGTSLPVEIVLTVMSCFVSLIREAVEGDYTVWAASAEEDVVLYPQLISPEGEFITGKQRLCFGYVHMPV
jgi:hypothetical protein